MKIKAWKVMLVVMVPVAIAGGMYGYVSQKLEHQRLRNDYLYRNIQQIDKEIVEVREADTLKRRLIERMSIVEALSEGVAKPLEVLQVLQNVPEGVSLFQVTASGRTVTVMGVSTDSDKVARYLKRLQDSEVMTVDSLDKLEARQERVETQATSYIFRVTGNVVRR